MPEADGAPDTRPAMDPPRKDELLDDTALLQPPNAAACFTTDVLRGLNGAMLRTDLNRNAAAAAAMAAMPAPVESLRFGPELWPFPAL